MMRGSTLKGRAGGSFLAKGSPLSLGARALLAILRSHGEGDLRTGDCLKPIAIILGQDDLPARILIVPVLGGSPPPMIEVVALELANHRWKYNLKIDLNYFSFVHSSVSQRAAIFYNNHLATYILERPEFIPIIQKLYLLSQK